MTGKKRIKYCHIKAANQSVKKMLGRRRRSMTVQEVWRIIYRQTVPHGELKLNDITLCRSRRSTDREGVFLLLSLHRLNKHRQKAGQDVGGSLSSSTFTETPSFSSHTCTQTMLLVVVSKVRSQLGCTLIGTPPSFNIYRHIYDQS